MEYKKIPDIKSETDKSIREEFNSKVISAIEHNTQVAANGLDLEVDSLQTIKDTEKTTKPIKEKINIEFGYVLKNLTSIAAQTSMRKPCTDLKAEGSTAKRLRVGINKVLSDIRKSFDSVSTEPIVPMEPTKQEIKKLPEEQKTDCSKCLEIAELFDKAQRKFTSVINILNENQNKLILAVGDIHKTQVNLVQQIGSVIHTLKDLGDIVRSLADIKQQQFTTPSCVPDEKQELVLRYLEDKIDIKKTMTKEDIIETLDEKGVPTTGIQASILNREISSYAANRGINLPKNTVRRELEKIGIKYIRARGYNMYHTLNFKNQKMIAFMLPGTGAAK